MSDTRLETSIQSTLPMSSCLVSRAHTVSPPLNQPGPAGVRLHLQNCPPHPAPLNYCIKCLLPSVASP